MRPLLSLSIIVKGAVERQLPKILPRIDVIHDISESEWDGVKNPIQARELPLV